MSEFVIYAEKKAFDEIIFNGTYPNLVNVFANHSRLFLNLTQKEFEEDIASEGEIFYFLHAYAGAKIPEVHPDHFLNVYEDGENLLANPRSLYFLNITPELASSLQDDFGIIVQSISHINDDILVGTAHRELPKGTILSSGTKMGWHYLFDFPLPPSNAILISDDFLFQNDENSEIVGENNLIELLDAVLPKSLKTEYHVLVVSEEQGRPEDRYLKLEKDLKDKITKLRNYTILFELVFGASVHKRKAFLNYLSITCDKGFAMFRLRDLKTVRSHNDFRYEKTFNRAKKSEGDTVFQSDSLLFDEINRKCNSIIQYIKNRHQDVNNRILGDSKEVLLIRNRLLKDI